MKPYSKIDTVFKRDERTKQIIEGAYTNPELEYLKDNAWVFTEKVDGTNIRVMWDGSAVTFGGKTDDAQMPVTLLYRLQELFDGERNRARFAETFERAGEAPQVTLYGEGYGAKIQKGGGRYKAGGADFVLFDVKIGDWWLQREGIEDVAAKLGIEVVPILGEGTLAEAIALTRTWFASRWGDFPAEGIVTKPKVELKNRKGDRIITKIKHRDFR